jgi:hypothetical protein
MAPAADVDVFLEVVSEALAVGVAEPSAIVGVALGPDRVSSHTMEGLTFSGCGYSLLFLFPLMTDVVSASVFGDLYVAVILPDGSAANLAPELLCARHVGNCTLPKIPSQVG